MEAPRISGAIPLTSPILPKPLPLETPVLELPKAEVPSYTPMVFPFGAGATNGSVQIDNAKPAGEEQEKKSAPPVVPPIAAPALPTPKTEDLSSESTPSSLRETKDLPQLAEATTINLPGTDIQIPVPKAEIVTAAAVTSVVSVAATLTATSLFKQLVSLFKPVINVVIKKINKLRNKKVITFGRQRWELRRSRRVHKGKKGEPYIRPLKSQRTSKS